MMFCPHCNMYMKPFDSGRCEFCSENVYKPVDTPVVLEQTCGACPEQYDAFIDGKQVAYLRLRWGYFQVRYPDVYGEVIYSANPKGDGVFESDERDYYLGFAKQAIYKRYLAEKE